MIRLLADADLDPDIVRGVRRREPAIDFQDASGIADGTPDAQVLAFAADTGRVLVTCDVHTMQAHFVKFVAKSESPGVILVPSSRAIGDVIDSLLIVWLVWTEGDLRNQVRWLP